MCLIAGSYFSFYRPEKVVHSCCLLTIGNHLDDIIFDKTARVRIKVIYISCKYLMLLNDRMIC